MKRENATQQPGLQIHVNGSLEPERVRRHRRRASRVSTRQRRRCRLHRRFDDSKSIINNEQRRRLVAMTSRG